MSTFIHLNLYVAIIEDVEKISPLQAAATGSCTVPRGTARSGHEPWHATDQLVDYIVLRSNLHLGLVRLQDDEASPAHSQGGGSVVSGGRWGENRTGLALASGPTGVADAVAASVVVFVTPTEPAWSFGAVLHAGIETIDRGGGATLMVAESVTSMFLACVETGASRGGAAIVGAPTTTSVLLAGIEPVLCHCGAPLMSTPSTPSMLLAGVEAGAGYSGTAWTRASVTTSVLRAGVETAECSR